MQTLTFYFVRHAPVIGQDGIAYGKDAAIDESCSGKFESAAALLPADCALWLSSEFPRAQKTAKLLQAKLGIYAPLIIEGAFNEQDFGDLAGCAKADIRANPANISYLEDMTRCAPPNGESVPDMIVRVGKGLQSLAADMKDLRQNEAVIVCHGGVIRSVQSLQTNEDFDLRRKVPHLSVHKYEMTV